MEEVPLILTLVDRAVRQVSLYGPVHPQAISAFRDVVTRLEAYFQTNERLSLDVYRGKLLRNEETVLEIDRAEKNYIQEMYIDGVRKLSFEAGVTMQELKSLTSVLARDVSQYANREEDTVTLLWKQDLQHIRYETVDVYQGDMNALLREALFLEELDEAAAQERNFLMDFVRRLVQAQPRRKMSEEVPTSEEVDCLMSLPDIPATSFQRQPDEMEGLQSEIAALPTKPFLEDVGLLYAEVLEKEEDVVSLEGLCVCYRDRVREMLKLGDVRMAQRWGRRLRDVQRLLHQRDSALAFVVEQTFSSLSSPDFYRELGEFFCGKLPGTPEDWVNLFSCLGSQSAKALCELLLFVHQETFRSVLVDFLIANASDQKEVYLGFLKRPEVGMVRDMIRVLSHVLPASEVPGAIRQHVFHENEEVRLEVLRATGRMPQVAAQPILQRAVRDESESVRFMALGMISRLKEMQYARPLAEEIAKKSFQGRSLEEKKLVATALGRCGGASALTFLDQIAGSGSTDVHLRQAALIGISEVSDAQAIMLLKKYASKLLLDPAVKNMARTLLKRREKGEAQA